jgi:hypothetical protein
MQPTDPYAAPQANATPPIDARSKVNLPAILIIASQAVGLVAQVLSIALRPQIVAALKSYAQQSGKPFDESSMHTRPVVAIIGVLGSIFVVYAMLEMRKLRRFPIAVTGTILAMAPFVSLCCCFGLPLGIWALVVLFNPDVRAAFAEK